MKFTISKEQHPAFLRACRLAETVAITRTTLPVLSAVLLTTQKRSVTIQANNLDEAVVAEFEADIAQNGQCAVMGRDLARIGALSTTFELEAKEKGVTIKCGGTFKLAVFPPEDFPKLPEMGKVKSTAFTAGELRKALNVFYASSDKSLGRYLLEGVYLDCANKFGVATDGRRLVMSAFPAPNENDGKIVPERACKMILALAKDSGAKAFELALSDSSLRIDGPDSTFYSKLIEGNYPNFRQVVPRHEQSVTVSRDALLAALDAFSFVEWDTRKIEITLSKDGGAIKGLGKNTQGEVAFACSAADKDFTFGVDPTYLRESASAMEEETITLEYGDEFSPIALRADSYAVIMLMRK